MLVDRLNQARELYAATARELEQLSGEAFDQAYERAENVRLAYELARLALDVHMQEHDC
jgi:hypothetical protein